MEAAFSKIRFSWRLANSCIKYRRTVINAGSSCYLMRFISISCTASKGAEEANCAL